MKKLPKRQKAFAYWKARDYSNVDAVYKSGYKPRSRDNAYKIGYILMQKVEIKALIEQERLEIFDRNMITDENILKGVYLIAKNGQKESNRLEAYHLLGKSKAMWIEKSEIKGDISLSPAQESKIEEYITNRLSNLDKTPLN